jgi:hypothetical protein
METTLEQMLIRLHAASIEEAAAKEKRVQLERAVAQAVADKMPAAGGTRTFTEGAVKFEVKTAFNLRTTDADKLEALGLGLVEVKKSLNEKAYKDLWDSDKDAALQASQFVVTSPAKPSVKIKSLTEVANGI